MKMNYMKPVVETMNVKPVIALMVGSGIPSFDGTPIDNDGPQGDAR